MLAILSGFSKSVGQKSSCLKVETFEDRFRIGDSIFFRAFQTGISNKPEPPGDSVGTVR